MESITWNDVNTIRERAFAESGMELLTIPPTMQTIGVSAFASSTKLASLSYPNHKIEYAATMFSGCMKLVTLIITGEGDMQDYTATIQPWNPALAQITSDTINEKITSIGTYAFLGMTKLTLNEGLTSIHSNAFESYSIIISIDIPSTMTTI